jgi:hypothetical protein
VRCVDGGRTVDRCGIFRALVAQTRRFGGGDRKRWFPAVKWTAGRPGRYAQYRGQPAVRRHFLGPPRRKPHLQSPILTTCETSGRAGNRLPSRSACSRITARIWNCRGASAAPDAIRMCSTTGGTRSAHEFEKRWDQRFRIWSAGDRQFRFRNRLAYVYLTMRSGLSK